MRRQAATILALSIRPDYIFFDETFDGLDPVMRNLVKKLICEDVLERNATAIITSHSLRELEDTCDQLALLHKGGLVLQAMHPTILDVLPLSLEEVFTYEMEALGYAFDIE